MNAIKLHWLPDRKFLAAGLSGIATWLLTRALAYAGVEIPAELQTAAVGLVMGAVHYFVPPHIMDILRRIDGDLKSTFPAQVIGTAQKLALAFLLLGGLALGGPIACSTYELTKAEAVSPAQRMFALQADYNTAMVAAVAYVESDYATKDTRVAVARLDRMTYSAISSASEAVRSGDAVATAVSMATARAALVELISYVSARQREGPGKMTGTSAAGSGS